MSYPHPDQTGQGHPQQQVAYPAPQPQQAYYVQAPQNGVGTAGFVTGLLGMLLFFVPLVGIVLSIIGVVLSGVGIGKSGRGQASNRGLAIAGLTCGVIGLAIWLILVIAAASVL
ncbi:DUF4190 domain-containing protein [Actinokineospora sp. NBRC 105648]|uniref:DUF4190 domain-containing protein n=1 Tax=Actinokineospora sp. NBRC 105648 TaxID=3032206 RepID=UPI0024A1121A|nr:DUF4190 domain-containing protein [Actinokineospora sp. NBRC 105648]GLZ38567.1 hypothetical protein Acsp05_21910 [Actinokineospora sp. NBRC 105648]